MLPLGQVKSDKEVTVSDTLSRTFFPLLETCHSPKIFTLEN